MSDDKCKCTLRESMLGDGCKVCQPRTYIANLEAALESAESEISKLEQELAEAKKDQARYCYAVENMLILSEEDGMFLVEKEAANKLIDAAIAAKESSK